KTDPRVIYPNLMAMRDWDGAGRLGEIEVPTLVCTGEADLSETNAEAERTAGKISQARQQVIADAAHMLPTEQPGALAEAVSSFLEALASNYRTSTACSPRESAWGSWVS
ncbi:MAG: hypothetical protein JRG89_07655, partial [Deltaproteobacteria bacterium]|nr:hypothetical protein [Deltaproteobacteria bacterium]